MWLAWIHPFLIVLPLLFTLTVTLVHYPMLHFQNVFLAWSGSYRQAVYHITSTESMSLAFIGPFVAESLIAAFPSPCRSMWLGGYKSCLCGSSSWRHRQWMQRSVRHLKAMEFDLFSWSLNFLLPCNGCIQFVSLWLRQLDEHWIVLLLHLLLHQHD